MKNPHEEIVRLDKLVPGGQALGQLADGRKVFAWGALPGEVASVALTKLKPSYAEGIATKILESSERRVVARDECYIATAPWQIFDFDYELAMKAELTAEAFRQAGITEGIGTAPVRTDGRDYFYRNKMEYALWWDNETGAISLAFRKRGTHQKIPVASSSIERTEIFAAAQEIVADLNRKGEPARKYQSLLVRCNQKGIVSSALFENGQSHPHMKNLTDDIMGQTYSYSPNGFFQINLPVYEMALHEIANQVGQTAKVVDMYAGVGTIGLSVARDSNLTLVEADASAYRELKNNITDDIKDVRAVHAKSENALQYITHDITLLLDPPRAGLDDRVVARILDVQPQRVIYLSCNPTTQARDVARLLASYEITFSRIFNFFPRTPHIESLVVLQNRP